jgi:hypothetical protein
MRLVAGDFHFPGGGSLDIPSASVHSGWGRDVSLHVVGDGTRPLPDSVEVLFFSYLEDKLYRGRFALPRDSITRLFKEGLRRLSPPGGRATYEALVAGVAPGGAVAVWASGSERQVEVFFGQAQPADVDWHRAMGMPPDVDRRALVAESLAEAAELDTLVPRMMREVPVGRWAAYRTRYRWRPAFEGVEAPRRLERVAFLNGERDHLELPFGEAAARAGLPAPNALAFTDPRDGRTYDFTFDDEEVASAFARAGAGGLPVELVFAAPAAGAAGLEVRVRNAAATVTLRRVTIE